MSKKLFIAIASVLFLTNLSLIPIVHAVGINTNVALPVPKNHFVLRTQIRYSSALNDPTGAGRRLYLIWSPITLVYGLTTKAALFGTFPVAYRDLNVATPSRTAGIGDMTLLGRYEVYKKDWFLRTFRAAIFGGLEIPSGDSPFSSDSLDIPLGIVASMQSHRQEIDLDLRYKVNTEGNGVAHGDDFIYNLAYQLRILPWRLPETGIPKQFNLVIEANGQWTQSDVASGTTVANTGGHTLFLSPGLQLAMKRIILEASVQIPVIQDLNGTQLETTFRINGGMRIQL